MYTGQPLVVHFDGGFRELVGSTGIAILKPKSEELLYVLGEYDKGTSSNYSEMYADLKALQLIAAK